MKPTLPIRSPLWPAPPLWPVSDRASSPLWPVSSSLWPVSDRASSPLWPVSSSLWPVSDRASSSLWPVSSPLWPVSDRASSPLWPVSSPPWPVSSSLWPVSSPLWPVSDRASSSLWPAPGKTGRSISDRASRDIYPSTIPRGFLDRMSALLGDEFGAFMASYGAAPVTGLRVNTLKVSAAAFRAAAPFDLTPVPWCPAGFTLPDEQAAGKHPWHAAGLYYLQEPSAMAVAELLDPQPGERVLDLAAAPGGKATHIAALMAGQGLLIANELHPKRAWILAENLERWGAGHVAITNEPPERLAARFAGFFDRVLLDAPCSGEGMFRKSEAARQEWSPALVLGCAQRQSLILEHAARLVRPGGRLVYSTCAFAPEEDEAVIARFLETHADFDLIAPLRRPGFSPGRPDWVDSRGGFSLADAASARYGSSLATGTSPSKPENPPLRFAVRLWPHTGPGEGHFIAVLQRRADADDPALSPKPWRIVPLPRPVAAAYRAFCAANLAQPPAADRLALVGSYLYALPHDLPDLTGLRFCHPGWWLGVMKKDRFEPSHALALRLRPADALRCADRPADSPDGLSHLRAYLRGEGFRSPGEDGWTLVAADGFAVGWGKRVGGMLKSHYPKGLRWN